MGQEGGPVAQMIGCTLPPSEGMGLPPFLRLFKKELIATAVLQHESVIWGEINHSNSKHSHIHGAPSSDIITKPCHVVARCNHAGVRVTGCVALSPWTLLPHLQSWDNNTSWAVGRTEPENLYKTRNTNKSIQ